MNRQEFMDVVENSWQQLDAAIEGLDDATFVEPGVVDSWSLKDLLGHVTAWEQMALRHVDQWRRGEAPADAAVDDYNAHEAARRQGWSLEQVRQESAATRERFRAMLRSLTDEDWDTPVGEGERRGPLAAWIGGALGGDDGPGTHAVEHAQHIHAWRRAREHAH